MPNAFIQNLRTTVESTPAVLTGREFDPPRRSIRERKQNGTHCWLWLSFAGAVVACEFCWEPGLREGRRSGKRRGGRSEGAIQEKGDTSGDLSRAAAAGSLVGETYLL
ncbi:unnamed protein product [Calypogeia fissa]